MIRNDDGRLTPRQYAKRIVLRELNGAFYWREYLYTDELDMITEKERDQIDEHVVKFVDRIRKSLNKGK
jgi:hypothetical protein